MSRSVDLFIDTGLPMEDLAARISQITGLEFTEEKGTGTWTTGDGGLRAALLEHPYADDGDLLLGQYRYALSSRLDGDVRPTDAAETATLRLVADQLHREGGLQVLLVLDLQYRDGLAPASAPEADSEAGRVSEESTP